MHKVVVDTNVVVSATLSPHGTPAKIVNMVFDGEVQAFYNSNIMAEYEEVLSREWLGVTADVRDGIINGFKHFGTQIDHTSSDVPLLDEDDRAFYDTAVASGAILITGNARHYPSEQFIMAPSDFLAKVKKASNCSF